MSTMSTILLRKLRKIPPRSAILVVLGLVFVLTLHYHTEIYLLAPEFETKSPQCRQFRSNAHRVKPPVAQDADFLSGLWRDLHKLFGESRPDPAHIDQPLHEGRPNQDNLGGFFNLTNVEADHTRNAHEKLVRQLPQYPPGHFSGRGVVILGGGRYSEIAATSLGMLRASGSKLPVEVWHGKHDEVSAEWCSELQRDGMACRVLADYMDMGELKHGYQFKVLTMLYSTFEEILFIDADSMPVKSPDFVFDSAVYKHNGVILWPDYWKHTGSPWLPYLIGISNDRKSDMLVPEMSAESGQIYWNKKTHWKSLVLATYYNYFGVDFWYTVFNNGWAGWGDKDTFAQACKATNQPYYQVSHGIITVFIEGNTEGIGMVQADPTVESRHSPLFMHANIVKWAVRELLCSEDCRKSKWQGGNTFHMVDEKSQIHANLKENRRIFAAGQLFDAGIDPEPTMWIALEHLACRTHWGSPNMCNNARGHMEKTFGFNITKEDRGDDVCIDGPWAEPANAKPRPDDWKKGS